MFLKNRKRFFKLFIPWNCRDNFRKCWVFYKNLVLAELVLNFYSNYSKVFNYISQTNEFKQLKIIKREVVHIKSHIILQKILSIIR